MKYECYLIYHLYITISPLISPISSSKSEIWSSNSHRLTLIAVTAASIPRLITVFVASVCNYAESLFKPLKVVPYSASVPCIVANWHVYCPLVVCNESTYVLIDVTSVFNELTSPWIPCKLDFKLWMFCLFVWTSDWTILTFF
ncbi:MAG: hypothetical protein Ta2E_00170 [Mycoplasmoidaceae bacterium]|nr:MAG: hypothetical protein Ta2E_00170 [Mycoplasmoidaceae bacterium]